MSFADELRACDNPTSSIDCSSDERAVVLAKLINATYGGPIYPVMSCPAGPQPPQPMSVVALPAVELALDEQETAALVEYVSQRYDAAHSAWLHRQQYCLAVGGDDNEDYGYGPPPKMPNEDKSMDPDTVVFLVAGLGMVLLLASLRSKK